ncbi:hypothetical protein Tco_0271234 [Tanacetum coccineum]
MLKTKGKAKMIEPEKPLKKKDQILIDEEIAQKLQAQLNVELGEEEKLAKQREEDANIAKWCGKQKGGEGDGVSNWTSSGVIGERSIEDEEVSLVDGVLEGALGALGDDS